MAFYWSLSDSKSPQVSRTRLRILAVFSNAVVWIISTRPPTSKSTRPFNNPLVSVPNASITISTIVSFMFHSFFNSLARSRYLSYYNYYYYYYYYFTLCEFFTKFLLTVFHWSLSNTKSPQISRTFLSILTDLNNAVI